MGGVGSGDRTDRKTVEEMQRKGRQGQVNEGKGRIVRASGGQGRDYDNILWFLDLWKNCKYCSVGVRSS